MKIPDEEIKKGVELCFNNARSLIEDAETLLNQGSYGHALFLTISAIEELSKAFMYACGRVDVWKPEELVHDVLHHTSKYTLFVISILIDSINKAIEKGDYRITKPLDIDDFVELGKDLEFAINEIWKQRLQSLYVDHQQGKWLSPSDIEREDVETLLQYTNKYMKMIEFQCTNILKAPIDIAKQIQEYLGNQLFPLLLEQFYKNADELYKNKLISKRLYEKIKAERRKLR